MNLIEGIGGVILFSNNPKQLANWYRDHLGIETFGGPEGTAFYKTFESRDLADSNLKRTTAWAIIKTDEDITNKSRTVKINYRVKNMAEVIEHLKSKGITIDKTEEHSYGKFATVTDPESNIVELWEEAAGSV